MIPVRPRLVVLVSLNALLQLLKDQAGREGGGREKGVRAIRKGVGAAVLTSSRVLNASMVSSSAASSALSGTFANPRRSA